MYAISRKLTLNILVYDYIYYMYFLVSGIISHCDGRGSEAMRKGPSKAES